MTGGDGGAGRNDRGRRWDVALSFAGAQRDYVGQVAAALKARGVRCFYDADEQVRLWGTYLAEELPAIYARESAAVVVFISADYAGREWTRLERRAAFSRAVAEAGVYVLPARFDDSDLPGLLPDMVTVDLRRYTREQFAGLVAAKLADLVTGPFPLLPVPGGRPPGAVRVAEAEPRWLGVHAAISVPGVPDEVPPEYVPRDTDTAENGVRAKVASAARRGGFVLLTGGSSIGKTRCASEAVKELLPDWWLIHPDGAEQVAALAAAPPARMVVWLDELQRYLDGERGLNGGMIRALLNAPDPVVIVGTLWPDRYAAYTAMPAPGQADPYAREREVLELAAVIRISPRFSAAEQGRARDAATRDPRLAAAVRADGYGLTQTLAAAPQLVSRWEDAQEADPYAWAVLTAALDAARLGARAPLSAGFLCAAAPGYCTPQQQAEAPAGWFEQALAYATARLHGAAAALTPSGTGMSLIDGYTVADYLLQYAAQERRATRVPASTWDALLSGIRDASDAARLARRAAGGLLYRYAIPLYRDAADAGDSFASMRLAELLALRGDLDQLRARAGSGDENAAERLAERGGLDQLRARADTGEWYAAKRLADLLAELRDLDQLRARADTGDETAAERLADLLAERGDLDQLRARADTGDRAADWMLTHLLADRGDIEGLRMRANAGDRGAGWHAAYRLAQLFADRGDLDQLRARADTGDRSAAERLVALFANRNDLDGLRIRADAADENAVRRLAELLAERGELDHLRARADTGDRDAASRLADREDLERLRGRADAGDGEAGWRLAELLADREDLEGLCTRADIGDWYAAKRLAELLADRGNLDQLRARADVGDMHAARRLTELLVRCGNLDQALQILYSNAGAGNGDAPRIARLLGRVSKVS